MRKIIILSILAQLSNCFLNFGAKHCIRDCFNHEKSRNAHSPSSTYFCQHGRESGRCCYDIEVNNNRRECQEYPSIEMMCSKDQDFSGDLKYFFCIRQSEVCGTAQTIFHSSPIAHTLAVSKMTPLG